MSNGKPSRGEQLGALLTADDSPQRRAFVSIAVDALLDTPVNQLLDAGEISEWITLLLAEAPMRRALRLHVRPGWDRARERARQSGETLGDWVPEGAGDEIAALIAHRPQPKFEWLKGALDGALVQQLVAPVLQETLVSFVQKVRLPVGDGAPAAAVGAAIGGVAGLLKKQVEKNADLIKAVGKGVMGSLGAEMESRLQEMAKDFSRTASKQMQESFQARVNSPEGRKLVKEIQSRFLDHLAKTPVQVILDDLSVLPFDRMDELNIRINAHNAGRDGFRAALRAEAEAVLAAESGKTLRAILQETGQIDDFLRLAPPPADRLARAIFASPAFSAWLNDLIESAAE
ncbi:MAG: hypothetical protein GMKNLPBB_00736 [Myxococcota bacterium]|nr:hypothetical protein [Myxococcota bacterium]